MSIVIVKHICRRDTTQELLNFLHLPSAILVFLSAAWAVFYCGGPILKKRLEHEELRTLQRARMASLFLMTSAVVLYAVKYFLSMRIQWVKVTILTVELSGFFGFASHWLVMTLVIDKANRRIRGQIKPYKAGGRAIDEETDSKAAQIAEPGVSGANDEELFEIP